MDVNFINPFILATVHTFDKMLGCRIDRQSVQLKQNHCPLYPVSGIIGLSGNGVGTVVLSLSRKVALAATSTILMTDVKTIDEDVIDAVGELVNVVAGNAKTRLASYGLSISLPSVVTGLNHTVSFPKSVPPISVLFDSPWGPLALEVGLKTPDKTPPSEAATHPAILEESQR